MGFIAGQVRLQETKAGIIDLAAAGFGRFIGYSGHLSQEEGKVSNINFRLDDRRHWNIFLLFLSFA